MTDFDLSYDAFLGRVTVCPEIAKCKASYTAHYLSVFFTCANKEDAILRGPAAEVLDKFFAAIKEMEFFRFTARTGVTEIFNESEHRPGLWRSGQYDAALFYGWTICNKKIALRLLRAGVEAEITPEADLRPLRAEGVIFDRESKSLAHYLPDGSVISLPGTDELYERHLKRMLEDGIATLFDKLVFHKEPFRREARMRPASLSPQK